jgi:hypothetical protein
MHPPYLDSTWMHYQADDPVLGANVNFITYDMRCAGQTKYLPNGKHDPWTDAADLAMLLLVRDHFPFPAALVTHQCNMQKLKLPPVHILASEGVASYTALRVAALYVRHML